MVDHRVEEGIPRRNGLRKTSFRGKGRAMELGSEEGAWGREEEGGRKGKGKGTGELSGKESAYILFLRKSLFSLRK